jgi:hypothetical protein
MEIREDDGRAPENSGLRILDGDRNALLQAGLDLLQALFDQARVVFL